jgi:hypothetical protein
MKKRDKKQQAKIEKISLKRALYEKARRQKVVAAREQKRLNPES